MTSIALLTYMTNKTFNITRSQKLDDSSECKEVEVCSNQHKFNKCYPPYIPKEI